MTKRFLAFTLVVMMLIGIVSTNINVFAIGAPFATIVAGVGHSLAIKSDGSLWAWGANYSGQLGVGTKDDSLIPVKVMDDVRFVAAGTAKSYAIKTDGSLWTWGNAYRGTTATTPEWEGHTSPIKIMDDASQVALDERASFVIKTDGSLWAWGYNYHGSLGIGLKDGILEDGVLNSYFATPQKILDDVAQISVSSDMNACTSMAVKKDGSLWIWGAGLGVRDYDNNNVYQPTKVLDNVAKISSGTMHRMVLKNDESLWTCGYNGWGGLGDGTTEDRTEFVKILDDVKDISAGSLYSLAIKNDGSLWEWGVNGVYFDFDKSEMAKHIKTKPEQVVIDNVVAVSAGYAHVVAIKNDKSLWAWGDNRSGKLGNGSTDISVLPVKIMDDIMLPSSQQQSTSVPDYIYNETDPGESVNPPVAELDKITDAESAVKVVTDFMNTLSDEQKESATGADRIILFAEEAIARAATKTVTSGDAIIDKDLVTELQSSALQTQTAIKGVLDAKNVLPIREIRTTVRVDYSGSPSSTIRVNSNYSDAAAQTVIVSDGAVNTYIDKNQVATTNITVESQSSTKVSVNFSNTSEKSTVKVTWESSVSTGEYTAVVDENGNPVGGKYNPATDAIEAKISESGVYSVVNNEKNFADIKDKSQEMQDAIKLLASKGVINGTSATTFSPDDTISRAEIAALIIRMLGKLDPNEDGGFSDVTRSNWYFGTAGSSKTYGIINGYEDGTFRGTIAIPKDQIFAVSARVLRNEMRYITPSDINKYLQYTDTSSIPDWAKADIAVASMANLVMRKVDGSFSPNEQMTRGNAAIGIKRLYDKIW